MEKSYSEILKGLKKKPDRKLNDHVLIIDSMNQFIRSFVMLPAINASGHHTGGLVGYLRSLGFLSRTIDPTRIICVFDGQASSSSRKSINPEYKANRNIKRITNWELFDDKDDEFASMTMQMHRLIEYLQCLPVTLISIDKVEADDTIAYIAHKFSANNKKVTIVSSDKDFLQLVDDNIEIYSPIKKKTYQKKEIIEEIGVLPKNYLIMKALLGDKSDNLTGVKFLGDKTLLKEFTGLLTNPEMKLQDVYDICEQKLQETKPKKIFASIIYDWEKVKTNYVLTNLQEVRLGDYEINHILDKIKDPISTLQSVMFLNMLDTDQIDGLNKNVESWLEIYRPLSTYKK